jgi:hypothetical protein
MESPTKPYALKQNGDTLFIPTQVVVKHDTLVVIRTTDSVYLDRRKYYFDSLGHQHRVDGQMNIWSGGWSMGRINNFKDGRTKDTIYEHKIIYY